MTPCSYSLPARTRVPRLHGSRGRDDALLQRSLLQRPVDGREPDHLSNQLDVRYCRHIQTVAVLIRSVQGRPTQPGGQFHVPGGGDGLDVGDPVRPGRVRREGLHVRRGLAKGPNR